MFDFIEQGEKQVLEQKEIKDVVFENCKFLTKSSVVTTFYNCQFEGTNKFDRNTTDGSYTFTNCSGVK